jgi:hypothetical protein
VSVWRSTGLWVAAAAVVLTSGAARLADGDGAPTSSPATAAIASGVSHRGLGQPVSGNVVVTIPVAAFGPADGAPQSLVAGKTYSLIITVWIAATSGPALVDVVTSSGLLVGCARTVVLAGVTRLHCALVLEPTSTTNLTLAVYARTHDGGAVIAAYNHSIR